MDSPEKICLKWNDFQQNIRKSFGSLRKDINYSDVTLVCEDDQQIEAQHIILAASSSFFPNLLMKNKHSHTQISQIANTLFHGSNLAISFPQRLYCLTWK